MTTPPAGPRSTTAGAQRRFSAWRWAVVALAFPIAGYIGWAISGPVDAIGPALLGGALTGAGLSAVQWWAADGALGRAAAWIAASAAGYACGLAVGSAIVSYDTDLAALAAMGLLSGAVLGLAQGLSLAGQGLRRLALAWGAAMPVLLALGWCATTAIGVSVHDQFTVFGAAGAVVFTLLSGALLASFSAVPTNTA